MDFIERVFHLAPDGGNGSVELLWVLVTAAAVLGASCRSRIGGMIARIARVFH
ncbi:MAG TPA: hypothetical protein VN914_21615 [Polyangia bacterium]|nr:hypothetical protein [Polyangia bacterium]